MPNLKTSQYSDAGALTGSELVEVVQSGNNVKTTVQAIADKGSFLSKTLLSEDTTINGGTSEVTGANKNLTFGYQVYSALRRLIKLFTVNADKIYLRAFPSNVLSNPTQVLLDAASNQITIDAAGVSGITLSSSGVVLTGIGSTKKRTALFRDPATSLLHASGINPQMIAFNSELTFNMDADMETQSGGAISFTLSGSTHYNGVGIVARINTPASVSFPAEFEALSGSDIIDITKMNIIVFRYFENYDGLGSEKVLYSIKTQNAV